MLSAAGPGRAEARWERHPRYDEERGARLAVALGAPLPLGHVLSNRGLETPDHARRFLDPRLSDLHDPRDLTDVGRAAERIVHAIERHEPIYVQGDYDVDGITSTFLLGSVLERLGAKVTLKIPHRTVDGYGLSPRAVDEAASRGCRLVITVDCGITAGDAVERARERGLDVIVTDHHEPGASLPRALAVVNPKRADCPYPFKSLAGVGVTLKLVQGLWIARGIPHDGELLEEYLDVVALGTIADVVPLVGENRVLARLGLEQLDRGRRHGMQALLHASGLTGKKITSGHVAFILAPRINAAGRLGNAEQGLRLLLARDPIEARDCAESLQDDNQRRREMDERTLAEACRRVETELGWPDCPCIFLWSEDWHAGVLGVVAARLVERFQRPTLLVAMDGATGRGSGRSLPGLDLKRMLDGCGELLVSWGGHTYAAGLTVERARLEELRERFESEARTQLRPELLVPRLLLDAPLRLSACHRELAGWLDRLAPHGLENPEPVFLASPVQVHSVSTVGGGKHLKLQVSQDGVFHDAIGFGMGHLARRLAAAPLCELAFTPGLDTWQGAERLQLKLKGVRPA
jgi:single-stranded-DNA-specific exonuclease